MASKYKQKVEETRASRRAVKHVTPDEVVPQTQGNEAPPAVVVQQDKTEPPVPVSQPKPKEVAAPQAKIDIRTLAVDKTAKPEPVGSRMYPERHEQVLLEAFEMGNGIKPWHIVETALAEYFERRYGKPTKK